MKKKKLIAAGTACAAVIALAYAMALPKIYTAKAMLVPTQEDRSLVAGLMGQLGGMAGLAGGSLGGPTHADLYVTMLKSDTVKEPLVDRFKLMNVYRAKLRTDAFSALEKNSAFVAGKKDGVITITVDDRDPKRAADLANAYVDELGKLAVRLTATGAGMNRKFLEERLTKARSDLARAGDELKKFQAKNKAIDITGQAKASIEGIAKLRADLAAQEVRLATLKRQFTDTSQEVKSATVTVGNLREQIARLEGSGGGSAIPSVGSMPSIAQDYLQLMRDYKIQEALVELLTKQYEVAQLTESKDVSPFQIIQVAKPPERKSRPKRAKIIVAITFFGFVFCCGAVIIREKRADAVL